MRELTDADEKASDNGSYMGVVEFSPYPRAALSSPSADGGGDRAVRPNARRPPDLAAPPRASHRRRDGRDVPHHDWRRRQLVPRDRSNTRRVHHTL